MTAIGQSVLRKEAPNKVSGATKYNNDFTIPGLLHVALVTSEQAHANISVDTRAALEIPGVVAVITGDDNQVMAGEVFEDRPPLARTKVRYYGEPIAAVVANDEAVAFQGARAVEVTYKKLPVVNTLQDALKQGAPLVHENLGSYKIAQQPLFPQPGTNIVDQAKVRKGDIQKGWAESDVIVEGTFSLPQVDHASMETRSARAELLPDGRVIIHSSTQAPYEIQKLLSQYFMLEQGKVIVNAPLIGGAFGGKAAVQLELIAYMASKAADGRPVKVTNTREWDIMSSPVGVGMEGTVKIGATRDGRLKAMEMTYWLDTGAYTDSSPRVARAIASDCTGPYAVDNVSCDVGTVYTNHTYTTAWRSFGHMPCNFTLERTMDKLAIALDMDPLELRRKNALGPGDTTPTLVKLNESNLGNLTRCIDRLSDLIPSSGARKIDEHTVRATGVSCFWKTSTSDPNAISAVTIAFGNDGSVCVDTGVVEVGPGTKTVVAQIVAERLKMDVAKVHVQMSVNTQIDPVHWKTVGSLSTFMVGRAAIQAADDAMDQVKSMAATVLRVPPEDLDVQNMRVFVRDDPSLFVAFKDIVHGYQYPEGHSVGGQILGRGNFIMRRLTPLDKATGQGRTGPGWTVGAQAVEVELDTRTCTYRIVRATSVVDAGHVLNPKNATGALMGGMSMGLSYGSRECVLRDADGQFLNPQLRTYKVMRFGEQPEYRVDFVETPQLDAPFGARPVGEHGVIGMPAALASALGRAAGIEADTLPVTPELIWKSVQEVAS